MTKVISLSDKAYRTIRSLKTPGESFSDVVLRLSTKSKKRSLITFFGKWPGTNEEISRIKRNLEDERKRFKTREVEF